MMNKYLELYLKAYTNKVAADDSIVDDAAVGAGSGLFGGLMGYAGGAIHGDDLRHNKTPKIEDALDRIRRRLRDIEFKSELVRRPLSYYTKRLDEVKKEVSDKLPWYQSTVRKYKDDLDKLKQAANKQNDRYFKTWSKAGKLQNAIKKSKRVGGVAGAVGASLLGALLYNKLKKD